MVQRKSFDDLADLLSEGRVVDWAAAERDADASERSWIRNLHVIDEIGRVARADDPSSLVFGVDPTTQMGRPLGERGPSGSASPSDATSGAAADATTVSWGPLQLLEKVGSGSFGEVHRAWDPRLNRQVALKLMNARAAELPEAGARVLEEARLLARVEHPNVVRIYGIEEHDGQLGIWMEFVEGTDLASVVLERGRLDAEEAARLGAELCSALEAVHQSNVVHKDVKAQNIMLRRDGRPVLMDFGAGRVRKMREGESELVVTGTPRYMAPETFRREPATPQSDLYSVGVLLYNLVTGDFPVTGTVPEIMAAHEKGARTPLAERDPELPEEFVAVVERATAAAREERPATAHEMELELRGFVESRKEARRVAEQQVEREAVRAADPAAALDDLRHTEEALARTARPGNSRPGWLFGGLALAAAIAAVVVGYALFSPAPELDATIRLTGVDQRQFVQFQPGDEIGVDTELELKVQLTRDAYVYVLNRDAQGMTTLLYPMANAGEHQRLEAGREHTLPGEVGGERVRWRFSETQGTERFLVVASLEPLDRFETALQQVARIDASQIGGRQIDQLALNALEQDALDVGDTRGVVGISPARDDDMDVFAIAEMAAAEGDGSVQGAVFLYHTSLENTGR